MEYLLLYVKAYTGTKITFSPGNMQDCPSKKKKNVGGEFFKIVPEEYFFVLRSHESSYSLS